MPRRLADLIRAWGEHTGRKIYQTETDRPVTVRTGQ